jgi:hypothetical protein
MKQCALLLLANVGTYSKPKRATKSIDVGGICVRTLAEFHDHRFGLYVYFALPRLWKS